MPWSLWYYEAYPTETLARQREQRLKHHGSALHELRKRIGLRVRKSGADSPSPTFSEESGAGFTLVEVLVAVFVLTIGIGGVLAVMQSTSSASGQASQRLAASYLAQEGLEIVRNIRDSNYIEMFADPAGPTLWTDDIVDSACLPADEYKADYDDTSLSCYGGTGQLNLAGGFYTHDAGDATPFSRKIIVDDSTVDKLEVTVEVTWSKGDTTHTVEAATELYNWIDI